MNANPIPPATVKQLGYIKVLCKEQELDDSKECEQVIGKKLQELDVSEAAIFIDFLKAGTGNIP